MEFQDRINSDLADKNQNKDFPNKDKNISGLEGKLKWPVLIFTPILFVGTILVNYLIGVNRNREVSDKYSLWVTPPSLFFTIWIVIYALLIIANIFNLIKNVWSLKTHIYFGITNVVNIIWILIFNIGTDGAVFAASFILITLTIFIYLTWSAMGDIPKESFTIFIYILRNIFAFYLGWCIAASNVNFGMNIVYWWGGSQEQQLIVFWVLAPVSALGTFTYICCKYGKVGALSSFCVWLSVIWAFVGAAIQSNKCLNG